MYLSQKRFTIIVMKFEWGDARWQHQIHVLAVII